MKYQPFHDLPASQFEMLKADIAARGVAVPIAVDEFDNVIDGHQRRRACAELHRDCPKVVFEGLTEDEKMALAIALNAFRRHLTGVERSQAIHKLHLLGWSQRRIAEAIGVDHRTVGRSLASGGESAPPDGVDPETGEVAPGEAGAGDENEGRQVPEVADDAPQSPAPTVIGRDGKNYPAKKPSRNPTPESVAERRAAIEKLAESGHTSAQIADELDLSRTTVLGHIKAMGIRVPGDEVMGRRTGRLDPDQVMENTVTAIQLATSDLSGLVDFAALDGDHIGGWVSSLDDAIRSLQTLKRNLTKELTRV